MDLGQLKFDEKGLIPAVVQDFYTKEVLTVAYMTRESLDITMREEKRVFGRARAVSCGAKARRAATINAWFPSRRTVTMTLLLLR